MSKYTIGIDLGGTTMTAGIVNENYEIVGKTDLGYPSAAPGGGSGKGTGRPVPHRCQENKVDFADINYVGIGTPRQRELHHRLCRLQHELRLL